MYRVVKLIILAAATLASQQATGIKVAKYRLTDPILFNTPIQTDTTDASGKKFSQEDLMMESPLAWQSYRTA